VGAAHAQALVSEGARVVIGDILDDEGHAVAEKLGESAYFIHLDVTEVGPLRGSSLSDWQQVLDVNLTGAYLGVQPSSNP
jgi:3alpha(or 20beta)-hydroxysteroid dehydrogenase